MAGSGSRFAKAGFTKAKPFIDVAGKPMIVRVMENLKYPDAQFFLIGQERHLTEENKTINEIKDNFNAHFIFIDKLTEGTVCTILHARKYINNNTPLLIANSDQIIENGIAGFINDCFQRSLDGSILTFNDESLNPKWSFAKTDDNGLVTEVQEKKPISDLATAGIYLFRKGNDFVDGAIDMIINNDRVNNEFYTCPVYNYAIKNGLQIGTYSINHTWMHGLGTPEDLEKYLKDGISEKLI